MDWGDGEYERTATTLAVASEVAIDEAKVGSGTRVLDLGTGSGNAALAALRRGAAVVAVDPATRLLDVAGRRAAEAGFVLEAVRGGAEALPFPDASFDAVVSVFAVIFAPEPARCAAEIVRVLAPEGRAVLTSWVPAGPIHAAGGLIRSAMASLPGAPPPTLAGTPRDWGEPATIRALFEPLGAKVAIREERLTFSARSSAAWFADQEQFHPAWRAVRLALEANPEAWSEVRRQSIAVLDEGNEDPSAFRVTSRYLVASMTRAA